METISQATRSYERWLATQITPLAADLGRKHALMAESAFVFLRATFYRWAQQWPAACADLVQAPVVLAVGDLHVENFGTWRDVEGRLIWGINDFDEALPVPYTNDLVRLATSALLASDAGALRIAGRDACTALLQGYAQGLAVGGRPFVLAERNRWLGSSIGLEARSAERFWKQLDKPAPALAPPPEVVRLLNELLPTPDLNPRIVARSAGRGSLGRPRWFARAEWQGGSVAREIKQALPSAWNWVAGQEPGASFYLQILTQAVRAPDPFQGLQEGWITRRLAPDCVKVEVGSLAAERDEARLLAAMGWETANIHLGSAAARSELVRDLHARPPRWLYAAAQTMRALVRADWKTWQREGF